MALVLKMFQTLRSDFSGMRGNVSREFVSLRGDVSILRGDISGIHGEISGIHANFRKLNNGVLKKSDFGELLNQAALRSAAIMPARRMADLVVGPCTSIHSILADGGSQSVRKKSWF
jgi:hypothetical protein